MKRLLVGAGVAALLIGAGLGARAALSRFAAPATSVPVFEVTPGKFVRTVQADGEIKPTVATALSSPKEARTLLIAWLAQDGAEVKKGDVVIRFDNDEATRNLADNRDDRAAALAKIEREKLQVKQALAERERTAALTKEEIQKSKELGKKDPRFFPRNEVIESEIDEGLLQARLSQTQAASQVEARMGRTRVDLLGVDRQRAEVEAKKAEKILNSLEVRAPHDGTFVLQRWGGGQRTLQPGDRAYPGMRIADVAKSDRMEAEIAVLEADAGGLTAGKRATVVLDARPDIVWKAKVKKVDPFPKPRHPEIPAQYFGAVLSIEGDTTGIKPGQRLRATLVLEELDNALVVPRQAVFRTETGLVVHKRKALGGFEAVPVTLGAGTVGRVVVNQGLKAGALVAMRDPTRSADETFNSKRRTSQNPQPSMPETEVRGRGGRR